MAEKSAVDPMALSVIRGADVPDDRVAAAIDQEREIIGNLLCHPGKLGDCGDLSPDHFVIEQYGRAFRAMVELSGISGSFTPRSVHERSGVSMALLMAAAANRLTLVSLIDHAADVRRSALIRRMLGDAGKLVTNGFGSDPAAVAGLLRRTADDFGASGDRDDTEDGAGLAGAVLAHLHDTRNGLKSIGATTGLASLDAVIGGYRAGELVIIAARPGMGKTILAVSSARQCAIAGGHSVGLFSLEVGKEQTGARFLADEIRTTGVVIPYSAIVRADVWRDRDQDLADAAYRMGGIGLFTAFEPGMTVAAIDARIAIWQLRAEKSDRPLKVVFIDYLKFIRATDRYKGNRVLEIGEITGGLKEIAKRRGLCVVLLCQLNRGVEGREDKRPTLSDLRDSGEIEQDADIVMMLYRESYYLRNAKDPEKFDRAEDAKNDLDVIVEKNRVGECTTIRMWCDVATSSVRDLEHRA